MTAPSGAAGVNGASGAAGSVGSSGSSGTGMGGAIFNAAIGTLDAKNSSFSSDFANLGPDVYNASTTPVTLMHTGMPRCSDP